MNPLDWMPSAAAHQPRFSLDHLSHTDVTNSMCHTISLNDSLLRKDVWSFGKSLSGNRSRDTQHSYRQRPMPALISQHCTELRVSKFEHALAKLTATDLHLGRPNSAQRKCAATGKWREPPPQAGWIKTPSSSNPIPSARALYLSGICTADEAIHLWEIGLQDTLGAILSITRRYQDAADAFIALKVSMNNADAAADTMQNIEQYNDVEWGAIQVYFLPNDMEEGYLENLNRLSPKVSSAGLGEEQDWSSQQQDSEGSQTSGHDRDTIPIPAHRSSPESDWQSEAESTSQLYDFSTPDESTDPPSSVYKGLTNSKWAPPEHSMAS
ncbi:hypothetical protein EJ04DRAFT_591670 [Polyplosphaeria fusca]|uniref:Uncharacterized protein n=1 Tax=Polyplosphaeria fusca TaxID=682080 RepID=A0A9P4QKX5_9PLEO|nr:hypothetical protein EJ04DRAFT_591670 [Polyplosphaeria fusca]